MAEVPSTFQLTPGSTAPHFTLSASDGTVYTPSSLIEGKRGLLVAFVCNHCPFVIHLASDFGRIAKEIGLKGIQTVAISANDVERYPADRPEFMPSFAAEHDWDFPYLYDETQEVALAYAAACTPDFYLFDADLRLTYAGQFDDSRPGKGTADGSSLTAAVEALLAGEPASTPWYPSTGCNIKWRPGNEPDYFA